MSRTESVNKRYAPPPPPKAGESQDQIRLLPEPNRDITGTGLDNNAPERQTSPIVGLINSDSIAGSPFGINAPIGGTPDQSTNAGKPC